MLVSLSKELPELSASESIDDQARGVLRVLAERASAKLGERPQVVARDPKTCPNCGTGMTNPRSPYCGEKCREESAFVRQLRASLVNGAVTDQEKQASIGQNLWHLLGGGFPRRLTLIPKSVFAKVLSRGCEICGEPAIAIDHTGSG